MFTGLECKAGKGAGDDLRNQPVEVGKEDSSCEIEHDYPPHPMRRDAAGAEHNPSQTYLKFAA